MPKPNPKPRGMQPNNIPDSHERGWVIELLVGASANALGTWIALLVPTLLGILAAVFFRIGLPVIILGVVISVWLACAYIAFFSRLKAQTILNRVQQDFQWKQTALLSFFGLPLIVAPSGGYYWCIQNRTTTATTSVSCIVDTTNPNLRFIIPIVITLIFILIIYVIFKRKNPTRGRVKSKWQYPRLRLCGISSLYVCAVLILGVSATFICNPTRKIKVLVANFEDPDEQKARVTDSVLSQLRIAFANYNDVIIEPLGHKITEQEGSLIAQSEGRIAKADFVIWGWYGERAEDGITPLSLNLEILCQIKCQPKINRELQGAVRELRESDLKKASLRTRVTNEVTYATLFVVGLVRMEANDYSGAVDNFENAIHQTNEPIPGIEQRTIYSYLGTAYWAVQKYDKSLDIFQKMTKLFPNEEEGYRGIADAYLGMNRLDDAIIYYTQAISITPTVASYSNLGEIFLAKEDYDAALANFQKELEISPKSAASYIDRGHGYYFKRDYENAIRDYLKALELDSGVYKAYERLGEVYLDTRDFKLAIRNYTMAIECQPLVESNHAYYGRGLVYNAQGKYDNAISDFTQAISIRNDVHDYYRSRAFAYLKVGEDNLALPDLDKAIQLEEYDDEAYIIRAQLFEKIRQKEKAIKDYEKVLEITSDTALRGFANQHLTTLKSNR